MYSEWLDLCISTFSNSDRSSTDNTRGNVFLLGSAQQSTYQPTSQPITHGTSIFFIAFIFLKGAIPFFIAFIRVCCEFFLKKVCSTKRGDLDMDAGVVVQPRARANLENVPTNILKSSVVRCSQSHRVGDVGNQRVVVGVYFISFLTLCAYDKYYRDVACIFSNPCS